MRCQAASVTSIGPAAQLSLSPELLVIILDGPALTVAAPASVVPVALHSCKVAILPASGHKVSGISLLLTTGKFHRLQAG